MFIDTDFPPGGERRARRVRKLLAMFERDEIEAGVDALLAYLDARDGVADAEDDDPDQCLAGDDGLAPHVTFYGLRWGASDDEPVEPSAVSPEWRIHANDEDAVPA